MGYNDLALKFKSVSIILFQENMNLLTSIDSFAQANPSASTYQSTQEVSTSVPTTSTDESF